MFKNKTLWLLFSLLLISPLITSALSTSTLNAASRKPFGISAIITVPGNFSTIQAAINAASPRDTILVATGTYHEHLEVNKTLTIIGENQLNTIIDGDGVEFVPIVLISKPDVTFANLTVRNTSAAVETYGVLVSNTQNASLVNMTVKEAYRAIVLNNVNSSRILDVQIIGNYAYGVTVLSGSFNTFTGSNLIQNPTGAWLASVSRNNTFYHDNFINNPTQVDTVNYGTNTKWDNGYAFPPLPLTGGNYWSDYTPRVDLFSGPYQNLTGSDGIGDTPYQKFGVRDNYPLMNPWSRPIYPIANFTYSPQSPAKNQEITFNASASYDPDGYITSYKWDFGDGNVTTIPTSAITHAYANQGNYSVSLTVTDNSTLTDSLTRTISVLAIFSKLEMQATPTKAQIFNNVTISGTLFVGEQPPGRTENIVINYTRQEQIDWKTLALTTTDASGAYHYDWNATTFGVYLLISIWVGNLSANPAYSQVITVNVTKKLSTLTIAASPSTVVVGSTITITGRLTPTRQGENVTISYGSMYTNGWMWTALAIAQTDSQGNYRYNWTTAEPGYFYILNASWPGDEFTYEAHNLTGSVNITKITSNITISVDRDSVTVGSSVSISGKITPARSNVGVTILIRAANGTVAGNFTVQTDTGGNYVYAWMPAEAGAYQITASWKGDSITTSASSEAKTVNAELGSQVSPIVYYAAGIILLIFAVLIVWKVRKK